MSRRFGSRRERDRRVRRRQRRVRALVPSLPPRREEASKAADPEDLEDIRPNAAPASTEFWPMIRDWFKRRRRPTLAERGDPPPSEDPVRRILAVPRGPARLDMFEETLLSLTPGTHGHRGVSLAFHRELVSMAEQAGVDLALLKRRVEVCAEALVLSDERERAGELLSQVGNQHRASELFVSAGAIEKLEDLHFDIEAAGGGSHLDARLAFELFEARLVVGLRGEALASLEEAIRGWPDNPVYREVRDAFVAKFPRRGSLEVTLNNHVHIGIHHRWPLQIGRGETSALRLRSPLLSRTHAEIGMVDGEPYFRVVSDRGQVLVDGEPISGPQHLRGEVKLTIAGVPLQCRVEDAFIELWPEHEPNRKCVGARRARLTYAGFELGFSQEEQAQVIRQPAAQLNGEALQHDVLLLIDDRLTSGHNATLVVTGPSASATEGENETA